MITAEQAIRQIRQLCAADTFPTLDGYVLEDLLERFRRPDFRGVLDVDVPNPDGSLRLAANGQYDVWAPSTAYTSGKMVVPIRRNGRVYSCSTPGTSGADAPLWPTTRGGTVTDGTVVWTETLAIVWQPAYDIFGAVAEGWRIKAGKVADKIDFMTQGDSYNGQQLHTHCLEMAKYYESKRVASLRIRTPWTEPLDMWNLPRAN